MTSSGRSLHQLGVISRCSLRSRLGATYQQSVFALFRVIVCILDSFHFDLGTEPTSSIAVTTTAGSAGVTPGSAAVTAGSAADTAGTAADTTTEAADTEGSDGEAAEEVKCGGYARTKLPPDQRERIYDDLLKSVVPQLRKALAKKVIYGYICEMVFQCSNSYIVLVRSVH